MSKGSASAAAAAAVAPQGPGGGGGGGGGYLPYFDYHGIDPGAYYGIPYRQVCYVRHKSQSWNIAFPRTLSYPPTRLPKATPSTAKLSLSDTKRGNFLPYIIHVYSSRKQASFLRKQAIKCNKHNRKSVSPSMFPLPTVQLRSTPSVFFPSRM